MTEPSYTKITDCCRPACGFSSSENKPTPNFYCCNVQNLLSNLNPPVQDHPHH